MFRKDRLAETINWVITAVPYQLGDLVLYKCLTKSEALSTAEYLLDTHPSIYVTRIVETPTLITGVKK